MYIQVTPVAKPRMTRSDKWKQRPIVMAYRQYKDDLREKAPQLEKNVEDKLWLVFVLPTARTWSLKKKGRFYGIPHQQTPDIDNLVKGFLDALLKEDCTVHEIHARKIWGKIGGIYYGKDDYVHSSTQAGQEPEIGQIPTGSEVALAPNFASRVRGHRHSGVRGVLPRIPRGRAHGTTEGV